MVSRKKDTYWHTVAEGLIVGGLKPAQIGKVLRDIFPETEVNGRHIGAYKRRLSTDGVEIAIRPTITMNDAYDVGRALVTDEDRFIYECSVGSVKRSLKCFEFKLVKEAEAEIDSMEDIDIWVSGLNQA